MFEAGLLKGKKILVTGGGTGLGRSMAARMAELGAVLALCGRRQEVLDQTAEEFRRDHGATVTTHRCDVRDAEAVEAMMADIWRDGPLDVLLNNAAGNFIAQTHRLSARAMDSVLNIVLHGTAYCTLAAGRRWIEEGRKANVLSVVAAYAWTGAPFVVPSAMAKAGVLAMTRSLAVEWGRHGIRVNAICPGPFPTPGAWERLFPKERGGDEDLIRSIPLGRTGQHEELANLACYMVSDYAGYQTGEVSVLDGGRWLMGGASRNLLEWSDAQWDAIRPKKT